MILDYYPFGLTMPGRSSNSANPNDDYKFTAYEFDDEGGLQLYYAGARMYDPVIGRFMSIDRFYDMYPSMSPYQYAANNPINFIDINGDSVYQITKDVELNGAKTGSHHAYLLLVPDDMDAFKEGEYGHLLQEYSFTDEDGNEKTRMGIVARAGPECDFPNLGDLIGQTNEEDNPGTDMQTSTELITSDLSDTDFITNILDNHANYQQRQTQEGGVPKYSLPSGLSGVIGRERTKNLNGYNSNSYVSGLIISAGGLANNPNVKTPLYANPVHPKYFLLPKN